jgi:hypothetical protein
MPVRQMLPMVAEGRFRPNQVLTEQTTSDRVGNMKSLPSLDTYGVKRGFWASRFPALVFLFTGKTQKDGLEG